MKKTFIFGALLSAITLLACNKASDRASEISLIPSTTLATTGETVAVTLTSSANASRWTVTPFTADAAYSITTAKVNYYTFSKAGVYTVSVSTKTVAYDSTAHQSLDSCWAHTKKASACVKGVDSTSTKITVVN